MVLKYGSFSKNVRNDYIDADFLKSIEICCPEMSFHLFNKKLYKLIEGDIGMGDGDWPLMLNTEHITTAIEVPIYHCPHCGKLVRVYVDDKLYKTQEQLRKDFE